MTKIVLSFPLLLVVTLIVICGTSHGGAPAQWRGFIFNGAEFREASAGGEIQLRDGYLPFRSFSGVQAQEDRLPEGTGGIAGICFLQTSGGKLKNSARVLPMAGEVIEIRGNNFTFAVRTDSSGYFLAALPPGVYELRWRGFTRKTTVNRSKTTLVSLRGGKRMVD